MKKFVVLSLILLIHNGAFAYGFGAAGQENMRSVKERQYENQKRDLQRQQQQIRQLQYQQNDMQRTQRNYYNYNDRRGEGITGVTPLR